MLIGAFAKREEASFSEKRNVEYIGDFNSGSSFQSGPATTLL